MQESQIQCVKLMLLLRCLRVRHRSDLTNIDAVVLQFPLHFLQLKAAETDVEASRVVQLVRVT